MLLPTNAFQGTEHEPFHWHSGHAAALLVHGFPGTPAEMRPIAQALYDSGWTTDALLLPGFGPAIGTLLEKKQEEWVAAVQTHLSRLRQDYDPVILVGYSLGGALSLQAATVFRPDALILLAPFYQIDHLLWKALPVLKHVFKGIRPFRLFKPNFNDPETRKGIHTFMPDADLDDPAVQQAVRDFRLPLEVFAQLQRAGQMGFAAAADLDPALPVLIIQGTDDDLVKPPMTQRLRQRIPNPVTYHEVAANHDLVKSTSPTITIVAEQVVQFVAPLWQSPIGVPS
jgi:carboxylesterase